MSSKGNLLYFIPLAVILVSDSPPSPIWDLFVYTQLIIIQADRFRAQELCESPGGRPGFPSLITYGFCGRKATLNQADGEKKKKKKKIKKKISRTTTGARNVG